MRNWRSAAVARSNNGCQQAFAFRLRARAADLADRLEHGVGLRDGQRGGSGRGDRPVRRWRPRRRRARQTAVPAPAAGQQRAPSAGAATVASPPRAGQITECCVSYADLALAQFPGEKRDHDRDLVRAGPAQQRRDLLDLGAAPGRGRHRFRRLNQFSQQHNRILPEDSDSSPYDGSAGVDAPVDVATGGFLRRFGRCRRRAMASGTSSHCFSLTRAGSPGRRRYHSARRPPSAHLPRTASAAAWPEPGRSGGPPSSASPPSWVPPGLQRLAGAFQARRGPDPRGMCAVASDRGSRAASGAAWAAARARGPACLVARCARTRAGSRRPAPWPLLGVP